MFCAFDEILALFVLLCFQGLWCSRYLSASVKHSKTFFAKRFSFLFKQPTLYHFSISCKFPQPLHLFKCTFLCRNEECFQSYLMHSSCLQKTGHKRTSILSSRHKSHGKSQHRKLHQFVRREEVTDVLQLARNGKSRACNYYKPLIKSWRMTSTRCSY